MAVTVCLADDVDVSRGDMLVDPRRVPTISRRLVATLVWMSEAPLRINQPYLMVARNGVIVLVAAISPYRATRDEVRSSIGDFVEVYVNAPLEVCEQRDDKGIYRQARTGKIRGFTGIDDPYEPPLAPEVECRTDRESVDESVERVLRALSGRLP